MSYDLKARNSKLEDSHPDASAFKNDPVVSEDLARWFASSLELTNPRNGIQIDIADDHVGVTIPYHHKGRAARAVVDELWNYLSVLQSEGYLCYDGQLEVVLDLETDLSRLVDKYEEGVRFAEQTAPDLFKRQ